MSDENKKRDFGSLWAVRFTRNDNALQKAFEYAARLNPERYLRPDQSINKSRFLEEASAYGLRCLFTTRGDQDGLRLLDEYEARERAKLALATGTALPLTAAPITQPTPPPAPSQPAPAPPPASTVPLPNPMIPTAQTQPAPQPVPASQQKPRRKTGVFNISSSGHMVEIPDEK